MAHDNVRVGCRSSRTRGASIKENTKKDQSFVGSNDGNDYESMKKPILKRDRAVCTMQ